MAKAAAVIALLLMAVGCGRNTAGDFARLSDEFVYTSLSFTPSVATGVGLHQYQNRKLDDLLDDMTRCPRGAAPLL